VLARALSDEVCGGVSVVWGEEGERLGGTSRRRMWALGGCGRGSGWRKARGLGDTGRRMVGALGEVEIRLGLLAWGNSVPPS